MSQQDTPDALVRRAIEELASIVFRDVDGNATLMAVAEAAARTVPDCEAASVTLVERGRPSTPVATAAAAAEVDQAQYDGDEGPCLDATRRRVVVQVPSVADSPWPLFRTAALAKGFVTTLSLPLGVGDDVIGALNLYGSSAGAFDAAESAGALLARHAAVTLANSQAYHQATDLAQNLAVALEHRDVIGQAKGILMATADLSSDEAFDMLRTASQRSNRKLYEVAAEIVERRSSRRD